MLPQKQAENKERPPRLLVDAMLGKLARWLRLMGYDAAYWQTGSDEALAAEAQAEGRLIVTRDRQLAGRRKVWALFINAEKLDEQIAEVRAALGDDPQPFSRCAECNGVLEDLAREQARDLVPPYVWHTQSAFKRCASCGRVYWRGTHWPGMQLRIDEDE
jgi:uncharacterized protein